MWKEVRKNLIYKLWDSYKISVPFYMELFNEDELIFDHLAIIDLPSIYSGIPYLKKVFHKIGFEYAGEGYLAEKQNSFCWLREQGNYAKLPEDVLPQIVVADFNFEVLSPKVQAIVKKYAEYSRPIDQQMFSELVLSVEAGNKSVLPDMVEFLYHFIITKPWPSPSLAEFQTVHQENELIAWVLAFGRKVNHFGIPIHLLKSFANIEDFVNYLDRTKLVSLNHKHSLIKGGENVGIAQVSTEGINIEIPLTDTTIALPDCFMEFVWRYSNKKDPKYWHDYYLDFVPQNANYIIESIYQ